MAKKLAFVLGGGGARGAFQVGALYALLECGLQPDLWVGVSIGAANATFLVLNGFSRESLDNLVSIWHKVSQADLLPSNYIWLTVRAMVGRSSRDPSRRLKDFLISNGINPNLCFMDINKAGLILVSSDLNTGKPILHGAQPEDKVLDALLLSTALPPWFLPERNEGRYLIDGGIVSNLPIEPALNSGATEIVALDVTDSLDVNKGENGLRGFVDRMVYSLEKRKKDLELELAEARRVPLLYLDLTSGPSTQIWDFHHTDDLIARGYDITRQTVLEQRLTHPILAALAG